jgi:group II intron reverse transcriptase/maturase
MIFDEICAMENLKEAWAKVRLNRGAPGIDRVSCEDYEKHLAFNLVSLQKQLQEGTYRPMPIAVFKSKAAGRKDRPLGISTVRDRVVQQAILRALSPRFENSFLPCSYAYIRKKSAHSAVSKASEHIRNGFLWVLQADVKHFFDTIDHEILLNLVRQVVPEKPVLQLLKRLLNAKLFREMGLFDNIVGTQQGSGISPLLSNIYLHPLDLLLWKRYGDKYLRYSDDICLFAKEENTLHEARNLLDQGLNDLKLSLHTDKTTITHAAEGIYYLGFFLDPSGRGPAKKSVEHLLAKLAEFDKLRRTDDVQEKLGSATAIVRGWYNYYRTLKPVEPANPISLICVARQALEVGEAQLARRMLKESPAHKHTHPEAAVVLGDLFMSQGFESRAAREYSAALQLDPALAAAKEKLRLLQDQQTDIHSAIERVQQVLHLNPDYREGYERLAHYYAELGLHGFAEKAHQKALELDDEPATSDPNVEELRAAKEAPAVEEPGAGPNLERVDPEIFIGLFRGRAGVHAKQWLDEKGRWGFVQVDRGIKSKDVLKHLNGELTLASYLVTEKDTVFFIVFDVDTSKRVILQSGPESLENHRLSAHQDMLRIKTACRKAGVDLLIEDSGYKGRHGWVFFSAEVPANDAVAFGQFMMKTAGGPSEGMTWELFPMGKSERHKSVIKLPLGIDKKSGRRCFFLEDPGTPIIDQAALLSKFVPVSPQAVAETMLQEKAGLQESEKKKNDAPLIESSSPGLKKMLDGCRLVRYLVKKAQDTNYLSHMERVCLLYTLSFAGKEGEKFLYQVMGYCINYNPGITQKFIGRRKESPISCAKIMEYFPELASSLPCDCKFNLPPHSYPSPVLYYLLEQLEDATVNHFFHENPADDFPAEIGPAKTPESDPSRNRVLDFEGIFSQEIADVVEPGAESLDLQPCMAEKLLPVPSEASTLKAPQEIQKTVGNYIEKGLQFSSGQQDIAEPCLKPFAEAAPSVKEDPWPLVMDFIQRRHAHQETAKELTESTQRIEAMMAECGTDRIETEMGSIQRSRMEDGRLELLLSIKNS